MRALPLRAALIAGLPIVGFFGVALFGGWTGLAFGLAFSVCRGMNQVVMRHAINVRVPEAMRATANSVAALGMHVLFAAWDPSSATPWTKWGPAGALRRAGLASVAVALTASLPLLPAAWTLGAA